MKTETLVDIAKRHGHYDEFGYCVITEGEELVSFLSDPAILAHIPAYAALREENERLTDRIVSMETLHLRTATTLAITGISPKDKRIADLESQLAALQGGSSEAVAEIVPYLNCIGGANMGFKTIKLLADLPAGTKLYTHAQPAIPPGYALVPTTMTDEMRDAGNVYTLNRATLACIWRDMLAASPSTPIAEPISTIPPGYAVPSDNDGKEQDAFEEWAKANRYDMTTHPLHWLFLDAKTYAARDGWRGALQYVAKMLASAPAIQPQASTKPTDVPPGFYYDEELQAYVAAKPTEQEKDAARWQEARKYLSIEDIEAWYSREWKGHEPTEFESAKSDAAIDAALAAHQQDTVAEKGEKCRKCGDILTGHEDESGSICRWCGAGWVASDENNYQSATPVDSVEEGK